jgi:hypothetical protein
MLPGLRLRQVRERLGLTYRDVESASYELAALRGSSNFIRTSAGWLTSKIEMSCRACTSSIRLPRFIT